MARSNSRRAAVVAVVVVALAGLAAPAAGAATSPEVKSLQKQVKTLKTQVTALRAQVNALTASVGEVSAKTDTAGQNATAAVTKTNCLVNATPLVLWSNDVYVEPPNTLFADSGLSVSTAADPVSGYVAGINPTCVPSVFPRVGASAFRAFAVGLSAGARVHPR